MLGEEAETIPLPSEDLTVETRSVETGRVRVRTFVREREDYARADLLRESVEVERVPIGREVSEVPAVREEGDLLIVPVVEEILVVEKRLFLREEIRLTRTRSLEHVEEPVRLRSMQAAVERETTEDTITSEEK